ncbi:hypothetical protein XENORESO_011571 [Xenotaenia resolanae]|uniref:Uncharacterized protein n=1 Tax=Xenotaenia resolanae TaxID=208358 RepID=A0ABV0WBJ9_9TELE
MTMGAAQSPDQPGLDPAAPSSIPKISELVKKQEQGDMWRTKVLNLLTRMVQVQEEVANHQTQVVQQLSLLVTQGSQQIQDLQSLTRHQNLLVENHQALLLQMSRIATQLQEINKKPAAVGQ